MKRVSRNKMGYKAVTLSLCTEEGQAAYRWLVDNGKNVSFLTEEYLKIMAGQIKRIFKLKESGLIDGEVELREFVSKLLARLE